MAHLLKNLLELLRADLQLASHELVLAKMPVTDGYPIFPAQHSSNQPVGIAIDSEGENGKPIIPRLECLLAVQSDARNRAENAQTGTDQFLFVLANHVEANLFDQLHGGRHRDQSDGVGRTGNETPRERGPNHFIGGDYVNRTATRKIGRPPIEGFLSTDNHARAERGIHLVA